MTYIGNPFATPTEDPPSGWPAFQPPPLDSQIALSQPQGVVPLSSAIPPLSPIIDQPPQMDRRKALIGAAVSAVIGGLLGKSRGFAAGAGGYTAGAQQRFGQDTQQWQEQEALKRQQEMDAQRRDALNRQVSQDAFERDLKTRELKLREGEQDPNSPMNQLRYGTSKPHTLTPDDITSILSSRAKTIEQMQLLQNPDGSPNIGAQAQVAKAYNAALDAIPGFDGSRIYIDVPGESSKRLSGSVPELVPPPASVPSVPTGPQPVGVFGPDNNSNSAAMGNSGFAPVQGATPDFIPDLSLSRPTVGTNPGLSLPVPKPTNGLSADQRISEDALRQANLNARDAMARISKGESRAALIADMGILHDAKVKYGIGPGAFADPNTLPEMTPLQQTQVDQRDRALGQGDDRLALAREREERQNTLRQAKLDAKAGVALKDVNAAAKYAGTVASNLAKLRGQLARATYDQFGSPYTDDVHKAQQKEINDAITTLASSRDVVLGNSGYEMVDDNTIATKASAKTAPNNPDYKKSAPAPAQPMIDLSSPTGTVSGLPLNGVAPILPLGPTGNLSDLGAQIQKNRSEIAKAQPRHPTTGQFVPKAAAATTSTASATPASGTRDYSKIPLDQLSRLSPAEKAIAKEQIRKKLAAQLGGGK